MRLLLVIVLVGTVIGCGSAQPQKALVGSFRGKSVREPKEPKNGAFTTVYIPIYEVGLTFSEGEFSGTQQRDNDEPIVIRGKYHFGKGANVVHFIAEDFANEVVLLDGVFTFSLKEKTLTLIKKDGSLKLELTRLPER